MFFVKRDQYLISIRQKEKKNKKRNNYNNGGDCLKNIYIYLFQNLELSIYIYLNIYRDGTQLNME